MIKPPTCAQGHAFQAHSLQIILLGPFAYEPNVIHGSLQKPVPTIGAVCGEACALAQVAVELSFCQARVCEGVFISSDMLLLFQHKFPLGVMPGSAKGTGSSRGFQHQANAPHLGRGANLWKQEKLQVLDRTKALYGSRTQATGKTNYLEEKL